MAKARARPLSTAEAVLAAALAYLILLISLTGARIVREGGGASADPPPQVARVVQLRTVAAVGPGPTCVGPHTSPYSYATGSGVVEPLAFGPPVEPSGPRSAAAINGVLIQRLCGGPVAPGGPVRGPDRRLFAALDAAVNGGDPNRPLTRAEWAAGVDRLITRDGLFLQARVVSRTTGPGTPTFGMQRRPGADPQVLRTRLAHRDTSRYLLLPVHSRSGRVVTLALRLPCGFQPVF